MPFTYNINQRQKSLKMTEQNLLLKINELPNSQWIKLDKDKFISSIKKTLNLRKKLLKPL